MRVEEFFAGQEIFLTGGSGFIGKALIEKLLRSCPRVGKVFVLLRPKKGKGIEERLRDILATSLFDRLRQEQPHTLQNVVAIEGDCMELGLGIAAGDLAKLQNVSIIFHSAASVRFDDPFRAAVLMNTRGTLELVKIAKSLAKLKVFVHVSTTYCNPDQHVVEEKIYPPLADWRTTIKLAETYSTETLNIMFPKYSSDQPNTYTFTKSLAEQIINDYKAKLPLIIVRPSIVVSSVREPCPGWIDNFNGPVGLLMACCLGILRTTYGDPDVVSDLIPIDIGVRAMILACYKHGVQSQRSPSSHAVDVYNLSISSMSPITLGQVIGKGTQFIRKKPFDKTLWLPGGSITRCRYWNFIRFITLQLMMALVVDVLLRCTTTKPFLLKLQRKIFVANMAIHYFATTTWIFVNEKFLALEKLVPANEVGKFGFLKDSYIDIDDYLEKSLRGAKQFLIKESPDTSNEAHLRMKIYRTLHYLAQLIGAFWIVRFLAKWISSKVAHMLF